MKSIYKVENLPEAVDKCFVYQFLINSTFSPRFKPQRKSYGLKIIKQCSKTILPMLAKL